MDIDKDTYQNADLTVFSSYSTEAVVAIASIIIAKIHDWDSEKVCRCMNLVFLSGGASGQLRNPDNLKITVTDLRNYCMDKIITPEELRSYTPTPLQSKILRGK